MDSREWRERGQGRKLKPPMPEQEHELPPDAATAADHRNPRRRTSGANGEAPDLGALVTPQPHHELERFVLHADVRDDIAAGLRAIQRRADLEAVWSISQLQPQDGRCILNFHGSPGTGKTRAALGVALRLSQPLYQVDYSAVISKYLGDTAKHIAACFKRASELGAVLFFDEADSLLSRRVNIGESCATSINQNRNVLMQELDRFNGVVIVTTNLFGNYDFGANRDSKGSLYFDLSGAFDLGNGLLLTPHVGYQKVRRIANASYTDYSFTLSKDFSGLVPSIGIVGTDADKSFYAPGGAASSSKFLGKTAVVLAVKYNF